MRSTALPRHSQFNPLRPKKMGRNITSNFRSIKRIRTTHLCIARFSALTLLPTYLNPLYKLQSPPPPLLCRESLAFSQSVSHLPYLQSTTIIIIIVHLLTCTSGLHRVQLTGNCCYDSNCLVFNRYKTSNQKFPCRSRPVKDVLIS